MFSPIPLEKSNLSSKKYEQFRGLKIILSLYEQSDIISRNLTYDVITLWLFWEMGKISRQ